MYTSGLTAKATSSDTAVTAVTIPAGGCYNIVTFVNEGAVAGFYSIDNGGTWARLPASVTSQFAVGRSSSSVLIKRVPGGTDLLGIYASAEFIGR
jgi:hypothetical protein